MNTSLQVIPKELTAREERALQHAVEVLEGKSFISRLTELTGEPLTRLLRRLPGPVNAQINRAVRVTLTKALEVALYKMGPGHRLEPPPAFCFKLLQA